jgi:hypothetical protein
MTKRAERVARDRNFMISLGIPYGAGPLLVPSDLSFYRMYCG